MASPEDGGRAMDADENNEICGENEAESTENEASKVETETTAKIVFKLPSLLSTSIASKAIKLAEVTKPAQTDNEKLSERSDVGNAEGKKEVSVDLPYREPAWSGSPTQPYSLEVLKGGVVVGRIDLTERPFTVCGRLPACDIVMEHPSISRYHAVIQYRSVPSSSEEGERSDDREETKGNGRPSGLYVYDLGSTHGTFLNKSQQLKPRCYYQLHVGHMLKFGGSSRVYLLQGPEDDQEEESPLTVTQIKQLAVLQRQKQTEDENREDEQRDRKKEEVDAENAGIDWGMGEDAVEEEIPDMAINPFALDSNATDDSSYADDPKKTLRGWFEREGYDLLYEIEEKGQAQFLCRIRLPLDAPGGGPVCVEALVKGKKKEAVAASALEACRTLDRRGVLRRATHESRQRKRRNWKEDDYYNSDDDTYLDRTGTVERKRRQRIRRAGKEEDRVETYETLMTKHLQLAEKITQTEAALDRSCKRADVTDEDEEDALDGYMKSIANGGGQIDKKEKSRLRVELRLLREEEHRLRRLIEIARPTVLPPVKLEPTQPPPGSSKGSRIAEDALNSTKKTLRKDSPSVGDAANVGATAAKIVSCAERCTLFESATSERSQDESGNAVVAKEAAVKTEKMGGDERKRPKGSRKHKDKEARYEYDTSNPDYAMWLPPTDQSGDGKTSLNQKYGY